MHHSFHPHRDYPFSSRERRVCRFGKPGPEKPQEERRLPPGSEQQEWARWMATRNPNLKGDQLAFVEQRVRDVPMPVLQRLRETWDAKNAPLPSNEELVRFMAQAAEFFHKSPNATAFIVRHLPLANFQTLQKLVDHREWIAALKRDTVFTEPVQPLAPGSAAFGPEELLRAATPAVRQQVLEDYVQKYIPPAVRAKYSRLLGPAQLPAARAEAADALGAVLGTVDLGPRGGDVRGIARDTLLAAYKTNPNAPAAQADFTDATDLLNLQGKKPAAATMATFMSALPPSRLLGALKLGIFEEEQLKAMQQRLDMKKHEEHLVVAATGRSLEHYQGITRARAAREAKDYLDVYHDMSGYEKLALWAIVGFAVYKYPKPAALLGLAYFGGKFLFKESDPIKFVLNQAQDAASFVRKNLPESLQPTRDMSLTERSEIMVQFLNTRERENLRQEATGLALLSEMPMDLLAEDFTQLSRPADFPGIPWCLQLRPGKSLDKKMSATMQRHGWKLGYREFFDQRNGLHFTSQALGEVFFAIARENVGDSDPRVKRVMEALKQPGVRDVRDFKRMGLHDARQDYIMLVTEGVAITKQSRDRTTLRETVQRQVERRSPGFLARSAQSIARNIPNPLNPLASPLLQGVALDIFTSTNNVPPVPGAALSGTSPVPDAQLAGNSVVTDRALSSSPSNPLHPAQAPPVPGGPTGSTPLMPGSFDSGGPEISGSLPAGGPSIPQGPNTGVPPVSGK